MCVYLPDQPIKYFAYMAFMPNLVGTFISSTYLVIMWLICIIVGCVLVHVYKMPNMFTFTLGVATWCVTGLRNSV